MDSKRFDTWTRDRALRFSRRDGLRMAAAGGAVKLASGPLESLAQTACSFTLHGETLAGPSASTTYDGSLTFTIGADGSFSQASIALVGGATALASGSLIGRAFDLAIALGPGQTLALSGVAAEKGPGCPSAVAGILSGPQPGDLGAWQASSGSVPSTSNQSSSGQSSSNSASANACPQGQVACGGRCISTCPSGQTLDQSSCTCSSGQPACQADQTPCESGFDCCSGLCDFNSNTCQPCSGLICGDMGCIDHLSDPFNCGSCGNACVDDTGFCLGGVCQCIPDNEPVGSSSSSCCAKTFVSTTGLCGCANLGEWCGSGGECCQTGSLVQCLDDGTGFKTCCRAASSSCTTDTECCFSSTAYTPQHACIGGVCAPKP